MNHIATIETDFALAVDLGLSSIQKYLPSKYFYDDTGSNLFKKIMRMPEYYPTSCEHEIFRMYKNQIINQFNAEGSAFDLIELGAGDGSKTRVLIMHLLQNNISFRYVPIDISEGAVKDITGRLSEEFPALPIEGKIGDYFGKMSELNHARLKPKIVLFLGSNIGNYTRTESIQFLTSLRKVMNYCDKLLIGFDMIKDPRQIQLAYDDPHGYTREFNMNLLGRINRELGGNFNESAFQHAPYYNPATGTAYSYLVSRTQQRVSVEATGKTYEFAKWETILTEQSQKYSESMIEELAGEAGFRIERIFFDSRRFFLDSLWVPVELTDR